VDERSFKKIKIMNGLVYKKYLENFKSSLDFIDQKKISKLIDRIAKVKKTKSRLFILGLGGSAGNASHAVNDFRKLCEIQAFTPIDNISEITATANDHGLKKIFVNYLKVSKLNKKDLILIFSVGGGNYKRKSSLPIIEAVKYAKKINCPIVSLTGKKNGYASKNSNLSITFKVKDKFFLTPVSETLQSFLWHYLVTDPRLQVTKTFW
tara:strand:+ start:649 stop:1272 length:624 start_codon:yes stop_codon:yes gene_type:complete